MLKKKTLQNEISDQFLFRIMLGRMYLKLRLNSPNIIFFKLAWNVLSKLNIEVAFSFAILEFQIGYLKMPLFPVTT